MNEKKKCQKKKECISNYCLLRTATVAASKLRCCMQRENEVNLFAHCFFDYLIDQMLPMTENNVFASHKYLFEVEEHEELQGSLFPKYRVTYK